MPVMPDRPSDNPDDFEDFSDLDAVVAAIRRDYPDATKITLSWTTPGGMFKIVASDTDGGMYDGEYPPNDPRTN
jgi:hypothetical protein